MTDDFHPEQYTDTYQEQLQELVEAKLAGGEAFTATEAPAKLDETDDVSDLLAKLEASVRARREQAAAAPAKKAPASKVPTKRAGSAQATAKKTAPAKTPATKAPVRKAPVRKAPAKK
jgi:DNA end-binding protein Ku